MYRLESNKPFAFVVVTLLVIVLLGAVLLLPSQTALAQAGETSETTARLNFRRGPGLDYDSIRVLAIGEEVTYTGLVDESGDWVQVRLEDESVGWVALEFLAGTVDVGEFEVWAGEEEAEEEAGITPFPSTVVTAATGFNLNLRSGPSLNNAVRDVLPAGTVVGFTGFRDDSGDWVQVDPVGSETGWVWGDFLTFVPADLSVAGEVETPDDSADEEEAGDGDGAEVVPEFGPTVVHTTTTLFRLNVRTGPSLDAEVVDVIPVDTIVGLTGFIDETGNWVQTITADGQTGWTWGDYLFSWPDEIMTVWEG